MFLRDFSKSLVIAAGLLATGCSSSTTSTVPPKMTNAEIEAAVNSRLATDVGVKDVRVSANADKDEVTLSGKVETQDARSRALAAVQAVNTTLRVTDKIDVKPRDIARVDYTEDLARETRDQAKAAGEKLGNTLDDAWIHTKIAAKFLGDSDTPARKINVDVVDNVVTLRGRVNSAATKQEAERLAKETDGVKRVINSLVIEPVNP